MVGTEMVGRELLTEKYNFVKAHVGGKNRNKVFPIPLSEGSYKSIL